MISQGAPTPVAGPLGVYCFFESGDLVAFDHGGKKRWLRKLTKEFGQFKGGHGVGSSLVGARDSLLLLIDHDGPSYLLCLDRKSGKTVWKVAREPRVSWTTPLYLEHGDVAQVVISSINRLVIVGKGLKVILRLRRVSWSPALNRNILGRRRDSTAITSITTPTCSGMRSRSS